MNVMNTFLAALVGALGIGLTVLARGEKAPKVACPLR
jgi:hypothetical protein